jgi:hypothetical protein
MAVSRVHGACSVAGQTQMYVNVRTQLPTYIGGSMRMTLSNGFPVQTKRSRDLDADELDRLIDEAEQRSVVVQGVRSVRMLGGRMFLEFHGTREVGAALGETGWPVHNDTTLQATLRQRDGVHPAMVVQGIAYGDWWITEQ